MLENLTWTCHICKEERPDRFISVWAHQRTLGDSDVVITENVRFCNDRPACLEGAQTFHHIGVAPPDKSVMHHRSIFRALTYMAPFWIVVIWLLLR